MVVTPTLNVVTNFESWCVAHVGVWLKKSIGGAGKVDRLCFSLHAFSTKKKKKKIKETSVSLCYATIVIFVLVSHHCMMYIEDDSLFSEYISDPTEQILRHVSATDVYKRASWVHVPLFIEFYGS